MRLIKAYYGTRSITKGYLGTKALDLADILPLFGLTNLNLAFVSNPSFKVTTSKYIDSAIDDYVGLIDISNLIAAYSEYIDISAEQVVNKFQDKILFIVSTSAYANIFSTNDPVIMSDALKLNILKLLTQNLQASEEFASKVITTSSNDLVLQLICIVPLNMQWQVNKIDTISNLNVKQLLTASLNHLNSLAMKSDIDIQIRTVSQPNLINNTTSTIQISKNLISHILQMPTIQYVDFPKIFNKTEIFIDALLLKLLTSSTIISNSSLCDFKIILPIIQNIDSTEANIVQDSISMYIVPIQSINIKSGSDIKLENSGKFLCVSSILIMVNSQEDLLHIIDNLNINIITAQSVKIQSSQNSKVILLDTCSGYITECWVFTTDDFLNIPRSLYVDGEIESSNEYLIIN